MYYTAREVLITENFHKNVVDFFISIVRHPATSVSPFALRMQVYFADSELVKELFTFLLRS
jgi:hypothetical protein